MHLCEWLTLSHVSKEGKKEKKIKKIKKNCGDDKWLKRKAGEVSPTF